MARSRCVRALVWGCILIMPLVAFAGPDEKVHRFDFGPKGSHIWSDAFQLVTENDAYSKDKGYGFIAKTKLRSHDRGKVLDELRRDCVAGPAEAAFRVDVPPGTYRVYAILGDYMRTCYSNDVMNLSINGALVRRNFLNWFVPVIHVTEAKDSIELTLSGRWFVNALLVAPADTKGFRSELSQLERSVQARTLSYYQLRPHVQTRPFHELTADEKALGLSIFQRDYMKLIWTNDGPRPGESARELKIFLSRNEGEPAAFAVYAVRPLRSLEVELEIPGFKESSLRQVEYLNRRLGSWRVPDPPDGKVAYTPDWPTYIGPKQPVDLAEGQAQPYWLYVRAASDQKPGEYRGAIRILSDGKEMARLPVTVTVWALQLPTAEGIAYETWYKDVWGYRVGGNEANYRDLAAHGINSLRIDTLPEMKLENGNLKMDFTQLDADIAAARKFGLANGILFGYQLKRMVNELPGEPLSPENVKCLERAVRQMHAHAKEAGWPDPIMFHLVDEPAFREGGVESAFRWYGAITPILNRLSGSPRFQTWCSTNFWKVDDTLRKFAPLVHVHSYNIGCVDPRKIEIIREAGQEFSFYSNRKNPFEARLHAGLFLWNSGAKRMSIVSYQYVAGDPFDDFTNATSDYTYTMTYPTLHGIFPNFAWECFREGTEDLRYIQALQAAIAEAERETPTVLEAKALLADVREGVLLDTNEYRKTGPFPLATFDRMRQRCVELIGILRGDVTPSSAPPQAPWSVPDATERVPVAVRAGVWPRKNPVAKVAIDHPNMRNVAAFDESGRGPLALEATEGGLRFQIPGRMEPFDIQRVYLYLSHQPIQAHTARAPAFTSANLMPNPSFEIADPNNPDQPSGFAPDEPVKDGSVRLSTDTPHSGERCLRVDVHKKGANVAYFSDKIPLKPNTEYVLSYWGRTPNAPPEGWGVFGLLMLYDANDKPTGPNRDYIGWHTAIRGREDNWRNLVERGYTLPGTAYGKVQLISSAFVGTAYYDDISLTEAVEYQPDTTKAVLGKPEKRD